MTRPATLRLQTFANIAGAALLWWLAAPLLAFRGEHPFDAPLMRAAGLVVLVLLAGVAWALVRWVRRRRNARLFSQLGGDDGSAASAALAERFRQAMHLLRAGIAVEGAAGAGRAWRRRRQVYELPWYVFIGAPGAGKTTALLHSGLRFPLAEKLGAAPVAGIGGTRQCDWWFTDRAVFIDTAGRYTTQDSHAEADAREWQTFLGLLRRYRPSQPINGVIVTVSVPDLLQGGSELEHQAAAVEARLHELRRELALSFPVYLLVTKADLLAGFVEFFGDHDAEAREQVWGTTLDYPPRADGGALPNDLGRRLAELPARIEALVPERLQQEPQLARRAAIYRFAAQLEAVLPALESFARQAFGRTGEAPRQPLRGLYFSSGTQEGNPIDRVLGELSRSYGMSVPTLPRPDAGGKAYFLAGLLQRLVIAEAPLAGTNLKRRQRRRWLAAGAASVAAGLLLLACAGWWLSYRSNLDYIADVRQRVEQVTRQIDPADAPRIDRLLPLYSMLERLAASGEVDPANPAFGFGFGLFQGPRLAQAADQTYHRVLDQTLAPLLAERLAEALRREGDPAARYEALRVAMMLTTPGRLDRAEVRRWAARAFAAGSPQGGAARANPADGIGVRQGSPGAARAAGPAEGAGMSTPARAQPAGAADAGEPPQDAGAAPRSGRPVGEGEGAADSLRPSRAVAEGAADALRPGRAGTDGSAEGLRTERAGTDGSAEGLRTERAGTDGSADAPRPATTALGAGEEADWLRHLDALLERNAVLEVVRLDESAIRAARTALAAVPVEQRVRDRLLQRARERLGRDKTLADIAGPPAVIAFAPPGAAGGGVPAIPAVYTRHAWRELIEPAVEPTIAGVLDEAGWVLADNAAATQRLIRDAGARAELARQIGQHQAEAALAQWQRLLAALALQAPDEGDALGRLAGTLAGPNSPLRELLRRLGQEFAPAPAAAARATGGVRVAAGAAAGREAEVAGSGAPDASGGAVGHASAEAAPQRSSGAGGRSPDAGHRSPDAGGRSPDAGGRTGPGGLGPEGGDAAGSTGSGSSGRSGSSGASGSRASSAAIAARPGDPTGAPSPRPAALAYDTTLAARYGELGDYARGPGPAAVDRLLPPLAATLREPAAAKAADLGRELRAEAGRAPAPLREMWAELGQALAAQQRRAIDRQVGGALAELAQSCRRITADRFPFVADARRDMPYADFARLFGPQGLLDAFFRSRLAAQVDTQRRPWRLTGGDGLPEKAAQSLRAFEMAEDIRKLFFPPGAELPQLRLQLTPVSMDGELVLFSADVDGQLMRYENGPRRPKPILWPGPAATEKVLMRILPAGPSGVGAELHEGPWALLRVLQRRGWQRPGGGAAPIARLDVDGRTLSVEVATESADAGLLARLGDFRCPEAW